MFNDKYGLTKAVLEGRKTMTRRIVNADTWRCIRHGCINDGLQHSPYKPGDVLAVAESYKKMYERSLDYAIPRYSLLDDYDGTPGWTNKMFVKPEKCSHKIRISNVRVERVQDISDEDCFREGIRVLDEDLATHFARRYTFDGWWYRNRFTCAAETPREAFAALFDKISFKGNWNRNPYVFVYEFELVK